MTRRRAGRGLEAESARAVVVVGAGASGVLSARALLRSGHPRVVLVERDPSWSMGPAYSTRDPGHVLNVPAGRLSVDSDRPSGFVDWASTRASGVDAGSFLPRALFGEYLRDSLRVVACGARPAALTRVTGDVIALEPQRAGEARAMRVVTADGRSIDAGSVVLALGNPPNRPLPAAGDAVIDDPWAPCSSSRVHPDDPVVIVGSGLTAVDVVLALVRRGHRGPLTMVSRHGLLPRPHADRPVRACAPLPCAGATARAAFAWMRASIADADGDWRAVFDAIRHDTNAMWARLPEAERARLLRHAARYWEVHRHRMAPDVAARVDTLLRAKRLVVAAGTVTGVEHDPSGATRVLTRDRRGRQVILTAARVVNCTGPSFDLRRSGSPLIRRLFSEGIARPGPLGLGLDVAECGSLLDAAGRVANPISVVGPLRRGSEWETTAIPDIRRHAEMLPTVVRSRGPIRGSSPPRR